jgi:hypothetical protein
VSCNTSSTIQTVYAVQCNMSNTIHTVYDAQCNPSTSLRRLDTQLYCGQEEGPMDRQPPHIPLHFSLFPNTVLPYIPQQLASYSFHINVGSDKHWITFATYKDFGGPYAGQRVLEANTSSVSEREGLTSSGPPSMA